MDPHQFRFLLISTFLTLFVTVNAVRPVVLSCDHDDVIEDNNQSKGDRGVPGKRGPVGARGVRGMKGKKGLKGEQSEIPSSWTARIIELERRERQNELNWQNVTTVLQELQEKINRLELITYTGRDCADIAREGFTQSGLYGITINERIVRVYCDLQTDGGGWLVIQRREDGSVDFYRNWDDYVAGFGNKTGEFWLGLENMHQITSSGNYEIRIDLEDFDGNTSYARYRVFAVGNASTNYRLRVGGYFGNTGNSLGYTNNRPFSTKDRDNDESPSSCVRWHYGAWWHWYCISANLNGRYHRDGRSHRTSMFWRTWKHDESSLKRANMKIRPM